MVYLMVVHCMQALMPLAACLDFPARPYPKYGEFTSSLSALSSTMQEPHSTTSRQQ
jgi:hypothetical protein